MVLFSCACRFFLGPIGWLGWILVGGCGKPQAVREDAAVVASSSVVNELDAALPAPVSLPPVQLGVAPERGPSWRNDSEVDELPARLATPVRVLILVRPWGVSPVQRLREGGHWRSRSAAASRSSAGGGASHARSCRPQHICGGRAARVTDGRRGPRRCSPAPGALRAPTMPSAFRSTTCARSRVNAAANAWRPRTRTSVCLSAGAAPRGTSGSRGPATSAGRVRGALNAHGAPASVSRTSVALHGNAVGSVSPRKPGTRARSCAGAAQKGTSGARSCGT